MLDGRPRGRLPAVGLSFGGGPFPPRSSKKISFTWPWLHFLEVSHSSGRGFQASFGAAFVVPPATWSSSSAAHIEDIAVVEEAVRMIPMACRDSDPRGLLTKPFTVW